MAEKGILLSKLEQEMLTNPEGLDARQKRNLSYRLKTKSAQIDQVLQEIKLLVENVSDDSIKENISNNTVDSLIVIFGKILQVLDPWSIGVDEKEEGVRAFRVLGNASSSAEPEKCAIFSISRTTTPEEIELDYRLTDLFNKIRYYVDPCIPDPVCRDPEYLSSLMNKFMQIAVIPFSFDSFTDETGVSDSGWILREPTKIDKNQLQWMRWKPRGLKECMKQPPLLKEKRLPVRWDTVASLSNSSTPEEVEKFNETIQKQNEGPKLTEKELSEVNERIKKIPRSEEESSL